MRISILHGNAMSNKNLFNFPVGIDLFKVNNEHTSGSWDSELIYPIFEEFVNYIFLESLGPLYYKTGGQQGSTLINCAPEGLKMTSSA